MGNRFALLLASAAPALLASCAASGARPGEARPLPGLAAVEELTLAGGGRLTGRTLKETDSALFVDVGPTVVEVPRRDILVRAEASRAASAPSEVASDALFSRARLPEASVREQVERFGEAVLTIKTPSGLGSGFVIHEDGYVVTNAHVVQPERRITATLFRRGEREFEKIAYEECRIVATNPFADLALIKIEPKPGQKGPPFTKVFLGDSRDLRVGQPVFAIGNPLGLERSVSEGIVSTTNREQGGRVYVQTTAQVNPGNSGGPLFNLRGEVVGVIAWKFLFSEGLNFAIPGTALEEFLRSREAFAFDADNPNTGVLYPPPPRRG
ncbi:MAG: S1C family serine protease [Planctomycetota bacterium]